MRETAARKPCGIEVPSQGVPVPRAGSTGHSCGGPRGRPTSVEKSIQWVPPSSPRLEGFLSGLSVSNPLIASPFVESNNQKYNS